MAEEKEEEVTSTLGGTFRSDISQKRQKVIKPEIVDQPEMTASKRSLKTVG